MKIYLIRHGQTDWNVAHKIQGCHDIPLNETGRKQAKALARGMEKRSVTAVFSSRQQRAMETAKAIADSQGLSVIPMPGLEEVEFGQWEGMTWKEIGEKYPKELAMWQQNPAEVSPPGGETRAQICERIAWAVEMILSLAEGDVAVVSHGAALAYVVAYMLRNEPGEHEEVIVANVSISTIEYNRETGHFKVLEMGDVSHLSSDT